MSTIELRIFRTVKKYDRSGRSSGVGIISFETPAEATRAKKQFDGILAKGKRLSFSFFVVLTCCVPCRTADVHCLRHRAPATPKTLSKRSAVAAQQDSKTASFG